VYIRGVGILGYIREGGRIKVVIPAPLATMPAAAALCTVQLFEGFSVLQKTQEMCPQGKLRLGIMSKTS